MTDGDAGAAGGEARQERLAFQGFTVDQWVDWLRAFLGDGPARPPFPLLRDEEPHHALIRLYRGLGSTTRCDRFREAAARIYKSATQIPEPEHAALLYQLIQLIGYTKPLSAERLLWRDLTQGSLRRISYGPMDLHTELLVAYGRYDVGDELVDYLFRSHREAAKFDYMLVCLHLLATPPRPELFLFLERVLPHLRSDVEVAQLGRQLKATLRRTGYRAFYEWYTGAEDHLLCEQPTEAGRFARMLRERVLPPWSPDALADGDPHAALLSAHLLAGERLMRPEELVAVARLHKLIGVDEVTEALTLVWRKTAPRQGFQAPWYFDSADSLPQAFRNSNPRLLSVETRDGELLSAWFDSNEEPQLDRVFGAMQKYDLEPVPTPAWDREGLGLVH